MLKRISLLIMLSLFMAASLTGCYDAVEIDDSVYTLSLGIDKGEHNKVRVTIQYPTYKSSGGGQGQDDKKGGGGGGMSSQNTAPGSNIHTIESSSILEALDMYGMAISRRVSLMHTKSLIFSEDMAKEGISRYLAPLARFREVRGVMNVLVTKGTAEEFIRENKSNIGESLAKAMELMMVQADNTSFFPRVTFYDFYRGMTSPFEQGYMAYAGINEFAKLSEKPPENSPLKIDRGYNPGELPRSGVAKREFVGTAVFSGDKMVGTLDSDETRYFLMVTGKFKRGIIDLRDQKSPDDVIPLDIRPSRNPVIKGRFVKGKPVLDVMLQMEADIGAIQSRINYEGQKNIVKLNQQAQKHIEEQIEKVIKKVQKEYKADIFSFGHKIAGYFPTIQEWEKYDWLSHFQEAKVNVSVKMNIRRTGMMINSSKIRGADKK